MREMEEMRYIFEICVIFTTYIYLAIITYNSVARLAEFQSNSAAILVKF